MTIDLTLMRRHIYIRYTHAFSDRHDVFLFINLILRYLILISYYVVRLLALVMFNLHERVCQLLRGWKNDLCNNFTKTNVFTCHSSLNFADQQSSCAWRQLLAHLVGT